MKGMAVTPFITYQNGYADGLSIGWVVDGTAGRSESGRGGKKSKHRRGKEQEKRREGPRQNGIRDMLTSKIRMRQPMAARSTVY